MHETAEELVLRPVSKALAGESVADARSQEGKKATEALADLEKLDLSSTEIEENSLRSADPWRSTRTTPWRSTRTTRSGRSSRQW